VDEYDIATAPLQPLCRQCGAPAYYVPPFCIGPNGEHLPAHSWIAPQRLTTEDAAEARRVQAEWEASPEYARVVANQDATDQA
jgi:hypothetical protein